MKLAKIKIGKTVHSATPLMMLAMWMLTVSIFTMAAFALVWIRDTYVDIPTLIGSLMCFATCMLLYRLNEKDPTTRFKVLKVIDVDATGTKATRVLVQYADGCEAEKTF